MSKDRRALGRRAERRAAWFLRLRGYRILGRNVRVGRHEIDLVARRGPLLVLVEVRYRTAGILAADLSIGPKKIRALRRAWSGLRTQWKLPRGTPMRFDAILVAPHRRPVHLRGR